MIHIAPSAVRNIALQKKPLRIQVKSGGCSGFRYLFSFDDPTPQDHRFQEGEALVIVDPLSMAFLKEGTLEYKDEMMSSSFVFTNPQAKHACGCGDSFSPF